MKALNIQHSWGNSLVTRITSIHIPTLTCIVQPTLPDNICQHFHFVPRRKVRKPLEKALPQSCKLQHLGQAPTVWMTKWPNGCCNMLQWTCNIMQRSHTMMVFNRMHQNQVSMYNDVYTFYTLVALAYRSPLKSHSGQVMIRLYGSPTILCIAATSTHHGFRWWLRL